MEYRWRNNPGRRAFAEAMSKDDAPQRAELAEQLGVTAGAVYFWVVGERRPEQDLREAIERLLGVSAGRWLTAKEIGRKKRLQATTTKEDRSWRRRTKPKRR